MSTPDLDSWRASSIRVLAVMETSWVSGPAKNLIEFAIRAASTSHNRAAVSVVTFQRRNSAQNTFVDACRKAGVDVHVIRERFVFDPVVIPRLRCLINELDPDVVQTHSVKSHFLMRLSRAHKPRPWIAFHHGYTWTDVKDRLYRTLDRWSLPAAERVVTVCQPFADALQRKGVPAQSIFVQHNSVNRFLPVADHEVRELWVRLGLTSATFVLLAVGRLSREKGHIDLIAALGHIRRERTDFSVRLVIVGDGAERPAIKKAAADHGVGDWIILVGQQADVRPYYALADIMVLPSHTEGSPNVLLEAMAAGVPTVATAVGGVQEIATNGETALLVEKENPRGMAAAILHLFDSPCLRRSLTRSARIAAQSYSPEAYCNSILALYEGCLSEYKASRPGNSNNPLVATRTEHQAAHFPVRGIQ